jgi:hypothetical protein
LILAAWCLSLILVSNKHDRYLPLCLLMGVTLGVELLAEWLIYHHHDFAWMYHVFVIIEYALLGWYFYRVVASPVWQKWIVWSIPVYAAVSMALSVYMYEPSDLPGQNINIEGILVSVMCAAVLLNLDTKVHASMTRHPDFWICCGLLVFFAGTFFSNGLFSYLVSLDREQARKMFSMVNKPLNLILYSCLTIGFICAKLRK